MVLVGVMGCRVGSGGADFGPGGDGPLPVDVGAVENEVPTDGPHDTGQADTAPLDTGQADTGRADGGAQQCDPNFGQAQACGGALLGTQWQYQSGCVNEAAFDSLKTVCPTLQISQAAFSVNSATSKLYLFANNTAIQSFDAKITYRAFYPQSCAALGCPAVQAALDLAMALYPGSTASCLQAGGGGCACDVMLKATGLGGGSWSASGGVATVTAAGNPHPYHYCIEGKTLTLRGTTSNNDQHVTYVLGSMP